MFNRQNYNYHYYTYNYYNTVAKFTLFFKDYFTLRYFITDFVFIFLRCYFQSPIIFNKHYA